MSRPEPDRDRHGRVADLFHRALEAGANRASVIEQMRRDDPDLAAEVEALLTAHDRAGDFIEQPAFATGFGDERRARGARAFSPWDAVTIPRDPVGHYRVLGLIGEGGMGVVYLAEDTRLGRTVALKAVRDEFKHDERRTARLRREARAAATLSHPNIATVYALEEIDDRRYIASEFVPGDTLRDLLAAGPLAPARARAIALGVARALVTAHAHGVVHRDLKPENIATTAAGDVKVLDFGLAQFADPRGDDGARTEDGGVLGTPAYMAPEQIRGGAVDARADLFALGVIIFELATGHHPFAARSSAATIARVLEEPAPSLADAVPAEIRFDPDVEILSALVAQCLEKAPERRLGSAREAVDVLETSFQAPSPKPSASVPSPRPQAVSASAKPQAVGASAKPQGVSASSTPQASTPAWWWQFHQVATTVAYGLLLVPVWRVRTMTEGPAGMAFFVTGLVAVVVAGMLRLHLWFALRQYPGEWFDDHQISRRVIRVADVLFVLVLAARGFTAIRIDDPSAALLIAAAASVAVSSTIIEPATTRAMRWR